MHLQYYIYIYNFCWEVSSLEDFQEIFCEECIIFLGRKSHWSKSLWSCLFPAWLFPPVYIFFSDLKKINTKYKNTKKYIMAFLGIMGEQARALLNTIVLWWSEGFQEHQLILHDADRTVSRWAVHLILVAFAVRVYISCLSFW